MTTAGLVCAVAVLFGVSLGRGAATLVARALVLSRHGIDRRGVRRPVAAAGVAALGARVRPVVDRLPFVATRAGRRYAAALPLALDAVARSLRSGHSLRRALADAGSESPGLIGQDLLQVTATADAGRPLAVALDEWATMRPRPDVQLVVAALTLAAETGGATAQSVDGVAATLRRRLAAEAEAHALGAQARTSAVVLVAAPLLFAAWSVAGGGTAARFLLGTPVGFVCLVVGLGLDAVGAWWMARLTRTVAR